MLNEVLIQQLSIHKYHRIITDENSSLQTYSCSHLSNFTIPPQDHFRRENVIHNNKLKRCKEGNNLHENLVEKVDPSKQNDDSIYNLI